LPGAKAHPFPFQIAIQTFEFIQGMLLYAAITDVATGNYIRDHDGLERLKNFFLSNGLKQDEWDSSWKYIGKYPLIFNSTVFQNVLVQMRSHWDWYIRQLVDFVKFSHNYFTEFPLTDKQIKILSSLGRKEIKDQIFLLQEICAVDFEISEDSIVVIVEMAQVRNLGLHNRWEVDQYYLDKTQTSGWEVKDIRAITVEELQEWSSAFREMINKSSEKIAIKYYKVPDFG
jgi:hypothetical protein